MEGPKPAFVTVVLGACALIAVLGLARAASAPRTVELTATEVVRVHGGVPVLVLRETHGERWLPLPIARDDAGPLEALLHGRAGSGFAAHAMEALDGRVVRLTLDELTETSVSSHLDLVQGSRTVRVEAPLGEGVSLALQSGAPILIDAALLDQSGVSPDDLRSVRAHAPAAPPPPVQRM